MKNILMIPSWYPTEKNSIRGSFFQEQANALSNDFNLLVGYVEFRRLNIIRFLIRLLTFRLKPHISDVGILEPPKSITFLGYGLSMRHFEKILPSLISCTFLKWLNLKLEIHAHLTMYNYIRNNHNFNPDLIYAMTSLINGVPVYQLSTICKIPVVLAEHVPFSIDAVPYHEKKQLKTAMESADALLAVSYDKARQILMSNISCNPIIVGNMVNESIFSIKKDKKNVDIPNILIVAAYNFYKDYITFFKSMSYLRTITTRNFTITIIGISPNTSKDIWAEGEDKFYEIFSRYNLNDITKIINFVPREEMIKYYHEADLFLLTSIQEGLPVSVLEAMSCGLPVFSTKCGGVEDFLDESSGRLFQLRDYKTIAETVRDWLEGRIVFDKNYIRKHVVEHFGVDAFKQRLKRIFNQCISDYSK